jgi:hypothetical protein
LLFLRFPGWLWSCMGSNRGYPNRARHSSIVRALHAQGFNVAARATRKAAPSIDGATAISLAKRWRAESIDDLCTICAEVLCMRNELPALGISYEDIQAESRAREVSLVAPAR